ncbi:MAG: hypothetical protein WCC06_11005 [Candidatus Aminicenantales bacterium]
MLSIDATLIIVFLIVWILVFVLNRIFFRPLLRIMEERRIKIQGNKNRAQQSLESSEQSLLEVESALKAARAEADKVKEKLETGALREKARLLAELNSESNRDLEKAKAMLNKEIKKLKEELKSEAEDLAERIEQRLLS